jgi:hypothetical protein
MPSLLPHVLWVRSQVSLSEHSIQYIVFQLDDFGVLVQN